MQKLRNEETFWNNKLPGEESHPVTDPLGENRRNPAKNQKRLSHINLNTKIINIICYYIIRNGKKYCEKLN